MNDLSSILVLILSVFGSALLGGLVLRQNPKSATNVVFAILGLSLIIYPILNFFAIHEIDPNRALLLIRILMLFPVIQLVSIYLFIHTFPDERLHLPRVSTVLLTIASFICMILAVSPWLFTDVIVRDGKIVSITGWGMMIYMPVILIMVITSFVRIIQKFRAATGILRTQMKYIMVGFLTMISLFVSLNFLAVVFLNNFTFIEFAPLYILVFNICATAAVFRYRFMNVRVIFRKSLIFSMSVFLATLIYGWSLSYIESMAPLPSSILWIIGPVFLLAGYEGIKKMARALFDRYIFTTDIDPSSDLDFQERFVGIQEELNTWFSKVAQAITTELREQEIHFFLLDSVHHDVVQWLPKKKTLFADDHEGMKFISSFSGPVFLSHLKHGRHHSVAVGGFLSRLNKFGQLIVPVKYHDRLLAFLILRPNVPEKIYSLEDLEHLARVVQSYARSLNESITYSEALIQFRADQYHKSIVLNNFTR